MFDAIIIGAGQAGPALAGRLTGAGLQVALIERKLVGGTCVNTGCMPTKTLIASARAAHVARRGRDFGVITGGLRFDMTTAARRARKVIQDARSANEAWLFAMDGLTFIRGHARLVGRSTVQVGDELLSAPKIFLNVGGRAVVPDLPGIGEVPYLDNTDMVALDILPRHLVIVGGGYVGLEFAQMYRRFGAEVTVLERHDRLVSREDPEFSDAIRTMLESEGVSVRTGSDCIALQRHRDEIAVNVHCREGAPTIIGSHVLLALGRRPNTDDLGLDTAGVEVDDRGFVNVDDKLSTTAQGIWALGECNGHGAFTHTAYNDFEIVAANLLDDDQRSHRMRVPAHALYLDPPLARAGLTERDARAAGHEVLIATREMARVGRAVERDETIGMMKLVADASTRKILGATIFGVGGDEAIHAILNLVSIGATLDDLRWAVPIHPTVAELLPTLAQAVKPVGRDLPERQ